MLQPRQQNERLEVQACRVASRAGKQAEPHQREDHVFQHRHLVRAAGAVLQQ